ncbi:ABC transporter substrate-binding protein [Dactylosporangium sp. CS-047395]|uniref:branched-chain amino acid ABC transporter substrate-binding protein n=1 Tax=Dactylosporangium sp. CS-047395 TaxID=3239936 RepID=UPI003D8AE40C
MIGPWVVGLAVAVAIAGGYAIWRFWSTVRFARAAKPDTAPQNADVLIKRAEAAVAKLREQTGAPRDEVLRGQIEDVDDHAAEVLADLRRFAGQARTLERALHDIPVERLRGELAATRTQRDGAGDAGLRAELDRSLHALEEQLAVANRLDTSRRTLLARIEAAVFDLEGLSVRVTEIVVMHDAAGAGDTEGRLADLTGDLEGLRRGLAEARGLSDAVLGNPETAAIVPPVPPPPTAKSPVRKPPGRARWDLVAVAVVVVLAATCLAADFIPHGSGPAVSATADAHECPQTLAFMGELTGDDAGDGPGELEAVELAVAQDNAAHGGDCTVHLQEFDTAVTGDAASTATVITADPSVVAVVGPTYGGEVTDALPVFEPAGLAVISPSASDSVLTTKGWTVFHRTLPSDDDQADAAARYLRDTLKAKHVFVVADDTAFGIDVAARVTATLGAVAGHADVAEDTTDWSPVVDRIRRSGADAVYFGGWADDTAPFVQRLRAVLPKLPLVSGDKLITETFRKAAGDAGHGTYATCPCVPVSQGLDVFRAQFKARFGGHPPEYYAPEAYDAAEIALAGLRAGRTSRPAMLQFVNGWDHDGLGRHIAFAKDGGLAGPALNVWAYRSGDDGYFVPKVAVP